MHDLWMCIWLPEGLKIDPESTRMETQREKIWKTLYHVIYQRHDVMQTSIFWSDRSCRLEIVYFRVFLGPSFYSTLCSYAFIIYFWLLPVPLQYLLLQLPYAVTKRNRMCMGYCLKKLWPVGYGAKAAEAATNDCVVGKRIGQALCLPSSQRFG